MHGVGLDLDEMPVENTYVITNNGCESFCPLIADRIDVTLKAGMILAVEPKAFLPGIGPVGVENTYVITDDGCESFCPLDLSLRLVS